MTGGGGRKSASRVFQGALTLHTARAFALQETPLACDVCRKLGRDPDAVGTLIRGQDLPACWREIIASAVKE